MKSSEEFGLIFSGIAALAFRMELLDFPEVFKSVAGINQGEKKIFIGEGCY